MIPRPSWMHDDFDEATFQQNVACLFVSQSEVCEDRVSLARARFTDEGVCRPPKWIGEIDDDGERRRALTRFLVKLAALYTSPEGSLASLSVKVGLNPRVLSTYTCAGSNRRGVSAKIANRIEKACGGVVRREQLCPEAFT
jgi:hypothetical protein